MQETGCRESEDEVVGSGPEAVRNGMLEMSYVREGKPVGCLYGIKSRWIVARFESPRV